MADLGVEKKADAENDKLSEKDQNEQAASDLSSSIWKSSDIAEFKNLISDQNKNSSAHSHLSELTITGLDEKSTSSKADTATEKSVRADKDLEKNTESSNEARTELEKRYGITIREKDGRLEYVLNAKGKETVLFDSDKTSDGLKEAEQKLRETAEAKIKELEEQYGIKISKEGQEITGVGWGDQRDQIHHARTPTLRELTALEEALKRAPDTRITKDPSKPLEVSFIKEEMGALGFYNPDTNQLFMFTTQGDRGKIPPTPEDAAKEKEDGKEPKVSLEEVISHELSHHSQMTFPPDEETREKDYRELGFVRTKTPEGEERPEIIGKDGYQYELYGSPPKPGEPMQVPRWYRRDAEGNYYDKDGNKVEKREDAHSMSQDEMREQALVRPPTNYFPHPLEMQAEMLTQLRAGTEKRGSFLREHPDLYEAAKKTDQRHIDSQFGTAADGASKMMRMPDGTIAENNKKNQEKLAEFERKWRK